MWATRQFGYPKTNCMKHFLLIPLIFVALSPSIAQQIEQNDAQESKLTGAKSGLFTVELVGEIKPGQQSENWMRSLTKVAIYHNLSDTVKQAKAAKATLKAQSAIGVGNDNPSSRSVTPVVNTAIAGNQMTYGTPSDNTMAISNGGKIVAADNDMIQYFTESGGTNGNSYHDNFFSGLGLNSIIYDPRLIYDPVSDRFIYVILHGFSSGNSKILVCFSKTNNPSNGWWIYQLNGNPLNNGCWTDYPNIGVSNGELFITGNLFTDQFSFNQTIIYQIGKAQGYAGQSLSYEVWSGIEDGSGSTAFTIVPASHGQGTSYGPEFYFVSARSGGFSGSVGRIYLYKISDALSGNAQLTVSTVTVDAYSPAADAYQSGSGDLLDNGDCRMHNAFYLNGIVHAVHHGDYNNSGYNGIHYYRIPVNAVSQTEQSSFGQSGFDYSYPSIASFGLEECDRSVMIGMLRSSSTSFPEVRVVNCDNTMNWSSSVQMAAGASYVNMTGNPERWGDYSSMSRKHNANNPEVWMVGAHGSQGNSWKAKIAEIQGTYEPAPLPLVNFGSSATEGEVIHHVTFYDSTQNNPIAWKWTFEGGVPATSTLQNPFVSYTDSGTYDVKLVATNAFCSDSMIIEDYIHVFELYRDTLLLNGITVYVVGEDSFELINGQLFPLGVDETANSSLKVFPNPTPAFEMVHIEIEVPSIAHVDVRVYDLQGRELKVLFEDNLKPGVHRINFNKLALPDGEYIVRVMSNNQLVRNEKIIVLH